MSTEPEFLHKSVSDSNDSTHGYGSGVYGYVKHESINHCFPNGLEKDFDTAITLVDSLPTHLPKSKQSNNFKIFGSPAYEIDKLKHDIICTKRQTLITEASSKNSLIELGKLVNIKPRNTDTVDILRKRIMGTFQNVTSEGTIKDILDSASFVLDTSTENINYLENPEAGVVRLSVPSSVIDQSKLEISDIVEILGQNIATGYELQIVSTGSLIYVTQEQLENDDYESDQTYAGLDSNGDITEGGGYSGLFN